jgi:hypothetical protein
MRTSCSVVGIQSIDYVIARFGHSTGRESLPNCRVISGRTFCLNPRRILGITPVAPIRYCLPTIWVCQSYSEGMREHTIINTRYLIIYTSNASLRCLTLPGIEKNLTRRKRNKKRSVIVCTGIRGYACNVTLCLDLKVK